MNCILSSLQKQLRGGGGPSGPPFPVARSNTSTCICPFWHLLRSAAIVTHRAWPTPSSSFTAVIFPFSTYNLHVYMTIIHFRHWQFDKKVIGYIKSYHNKAIYCSCNYVIIANHWFDKERIDENHPWFTEDAIMNALTVSGSASIQIITEKVLWFTVQWHVRPNLPIPCAVLTR